MFEHKVTDIFFDLDHTLWDFERNSALTFAKILESNRVNVDLKGFLEIYSPINLEMWKLYRENGINQSELRYQRLRRTFDTLKESVTDETIHALSHEYIEHLPSFVHLLPNALEVLEYLFPKYRLHIITNGFEEVQERKLKGSNIHHYFDQVINSEMAGVKKPDPYIFELALSKAKVEPRHTLMVGDNLEADILGAKAMGMQVVHFNSNNEANHDVCKTIYDLIEIKSIL
ncbi:noncanonical pyrimidine nucleotidase, YjjG family [Flagellimonas taeanensis]|uniref:YjjG family noncanonical pyrimidine nucleotidase n=1 Tax=Flavobacteriaceae TaxID=49546 RepID=UPI000E68066D|nr:MULTISPECIES: YjjG family noncanonical pyrimidine nucleotidase [Allomuricauda]MDC6385977.1 YjjG family noncanonical pyrimidine nucleotidase [Muricauda sp. SK9]RIV50220.1 noncanonical pyrimidine nucleotidase, YjjG family [Allomuricauda taeanensis]